MGGLIGGTVILLAIVSFSTAVPTCSVDNCQLPECRCSTTEIPGNLKPDRVPQFVIPTFDDGVTVSNINFYRNAFSGRINPNGCPVSATFFVSHEYTDYSLVQELYSSGHEIALHSITHNTTTTYWANANPTQLAREFAGERELIAHFTHIPEEELRGIRLPFLQMSGDSSFQMMAAEKFTYDCSWPTIKHLDLWPYSLDFQSTQDCVIGPCPTSSFPNLWVLPMVSWTDNEGIFCSMVDTCVNIPDSVEGLRQFMIDNFLRHYNGNRAPFGFFLHAAWFMANPYSFEAYLGFLDYLGTLDDVYIMSANQVLNWVRQPIGLDDMVKDNANCRQPQTNICVPKACQLPKDKEDRWMTSCVINCPVVYPWLGNPLGEASN